MSYLGWKLLHVAAVVIFLGNISTGIFWAARAHRTRDLRLIASTFEGVIRSDRWFTIPGVIGIIAGGVGAAMSGGVPILGTGWILWSIVLFAISGLAYGMVAPLQRKIAHLDMGPMGGVRAHYTHRRDGTHGDEALPAGVVTLVQSSSRSRAASSSIGSMDSISAGVLDIASVRYCEGIVLHINVGIWPL